MAAVAHQSASFLAESIIKAVLQFFANHTAREARRIFLIQLLSVLEDSMLHDLVLAMLSNTFLQDNGRELEILRRDLIPDGNIGAHAVIHYN